MSENRPEDSPHGTPRHVPRAKVVTAVVAVLVASGLVAAVGQRPHEDAAALTDPSALLAASVTQPALAALLDPTVPDRVLSVTGPVPQEVPSPSPSPSLSPTPDPTTPSAEPSPSPTEVFVPPDAEYLARTLGREGIPRVMLDAYQRAAARMRSSQPGCGLTWHMIAAIGRIESGHGASGRAVTPDGTLVYPILGPRLDGTRFARIPDTDGGRWDGDEVWDRAVGPMQFIPSTWALLGRDGSGDGKASPHNVHDATLATATYLCLYDRNLRKAPQLRDAYFAYNHSDSYVDTVVSFYQAYLLADNPDLARALLPQVNQKPKPPPAPETPAAPKPQPKPRTKTKAQPTAEPKPTPAPTGTSSPTPTATPPSPTEQPAQPTTPDATAPSP